MKEKKLKGPIEYIKEAFGVYTQKENFIFFAKIMAVLTILSTTLSYLTGYLYPFKYPEMSIDYSDPVKLIFFTLLIIVSVILNLWSQSTIYFSLFKMGENEVKIFKIGFQNILRYFLITLVLSLILLFGGLLLIIPLIIFAVWFSFSTYLYLDKKLGLIESLKTSKRMVKGRFFPVFGRLLVFGLFGIIISIPLSLLPYTGTIIVSFLAPFFMLPSYLFYKDLVNN